jgi:hypothetical protein
MSHWAEIDSENKVIRVVVGNNDDPKGDQGYSWLIENLGGNWIQTSYSGSFRFNFAGVGYSYDPIDDAFIPPMNDCGHDELELNELKQWECKNGEHDVISYGNSSTSN